MFLFVMAVFAMIWQLLAIEIPVRMVARVQNITQAFNNIHVPILVFRRKV